MRLWCEARAAIAIFAALGFCLAAGFGCSRTPAPDGPATIQLTSTAFRDGQNLPVSYTCGGVGVSPPLAWKPVPPKTASLALTCLDPDAPAGTFTHWLVYGIATST